MKLSPKTVTTIYVFALFLAFFTGGSSYSANFSSSGGSTVSAYHHPTVTLIALALLYIQIKKPKIKIQDGDTINHPGIGRKLSAIFIDLILIFLITAGLFNWIPIVAECIATNEFKISFHRTETHSRDWLALIMIPEMIFIFMFYSKARKNGGQTLAEYSLGIKILKSNNQEIENENLHYRTFLGFLALSLWPVTIILGMRDKKKGFWHENTSDTQSIRLSEANKSVELTSEAALPM